MNYGRRSWPAILAMVSFSFGGTAVGQEMHPEARNTASMKFINFPGFPTCAPGSVQSGDPSKGPSIILAKLSAGCVVPWHWHTPTEQLMLVSGSARIEPKDGKPTTLRAGAFALMPPHHVHQFKCLTACVMYVHSDAAFDIHYVDENGAEISPENAVKAVKEKTIQ